MTSKFSSVSIDGFIKIIRSSKLLVIGSALTFILVALIYILNLNDKYKAYAILQPNINQNSQGINTGGFAFGFGNFGLSANSDTKTLVGIETIQTYKFFRSSLASRENLKKILLTESWDKNARYILYKNKAEYYQLNDEMLVSYSDYIYQDAHSKFLDNLVIDVDSSSGFVSISYLHESPIFAKEMVQNLVQNLNKALADQKILESEKSIAYLNQQIQLTNLSEIRSNLAQLVKDQTSQIALAKTSDDYVFKYIEEPFEQIDPSAPNRPLLLILSIIIGSMFGIFSSLVKALMRR